ncbi:MAG: hypothetical protein M0P71_01545 [Melioribacteraceae bacterium]|nr:hypothetical protein [Melioribacteraceae bacterium]
MEEDLIPEIWENGKGRTKPFVKSKKNNYEEPKKRFGIIGKKKVKENRELQDIDEVEDKISSSILSKIK